MHAKPYLIGACLVIAAITLIGCGGPPGEHIVAKVGEKEISLGDFNIAHTSISVFNRPPLLTYEDKEKFLNILINKELLMDEARARNLDEDPGVVAQRELYELEYGLRALYKEVVDTGLEITGAEVEAYYKKSRSRVRARHILVATAETAQDLRRRIVEDGEDFATLAREFSIDEKSGPAGGDLGFIDSAKDPAILVQVAAGLEIDEVSNVVGSRQGYHVIQTIHRNEPSMDEFEQQRPVCAAELRNQKRGRRWNDYLQDQLAVNQVKFDDDVIAEINGLLPERGDVNPGWRETISKELRAKTLCTYKDGEWTVGKLLASYSPESGKGIPVQTPGGAWIMRAIEAVILNKTNLAEAVNRGILEQDNVARNIRKRVQERMLDILHTEIVQDVVVEEDSIRSSYERVKDDLKVGDTVRFCLISLLDNAKIQEARKRILGGESFEELALEYNVGPILEKEGMIGPATRDKISVEDLQIQLFDQLEPGEMTTVVTAATGGFLMAKLLEKNAGHNLTYEEAYEEIRLALLENNKNSLLNDWLETKRDEVGVKIFPEVLNLLSEGEDQELGAS